ncbi:MAG: N-acetyltransferase family protein [Desulfobacterales bacterium]
MIRPMQQSDGPTVTDIYVFGLNTRNATFETEEPTWEDWDKKHLLHSRFVYEHQGVVAGWAALTPVSTRDVYRGVAEVSVYIAENYLGRGIGSQLMQKVINASEANGIWTLFSSLFSENTASVKLHQRFGFRKIGIRERIAQLDGIWKDTLIMERRSRVVGI